MPAGDPITRAAIEAMSIEEFDEREAEIRRWQAAGAKDGEVAPPGPKRADGHTFTLDEVRTMSLADYEANRDAIHAQAPVLGAEKAAEVRAQRSRAGR